METRNPWLESRRDKLLFRIGQDCERRQMWPTALAVYEVCAWPGARHRRIRVLERASASKKRSRSRYVAARAPESEEEAQRIARMSRGCVANRRTDGARCHCAAGQRSTLTLPRPETPQAVEYVVRDHLTCESAPVHYVENALINSLFGLLCWEPVFVALPGAFFIRFNAAPADLHAPDFTAREPNSSPRVWRNSIAASYRETIRAAPARQSRAAIAVRVLGTAYAGARHDGARLLARRASEAVLRALAAAIFAAIARACRT